MKLKGKKILLLLLFSPTSGDSFNVPIPGRTRLMKTVFLFKEEVLSDFKKGQNIEEIELPEFFPWKYGPFAKDLLNDLEFLINNGLVDISFGSENSSISAEVEEYKKFEYWVEDYEEDQVDEFEEEIFSLTEKGCSKAELIWNELNANQKNILIQFKNVLIKAPLDRILKYVYLKYSKQGYTDKSLIREKYLA